MVGRPVFHPDPTVPFLSTSSERVVALIESLNQPQISIPGKAPQAVQAHLCGLRNADGSFSIFVALHLPESAENVIYVHEPRGITLESYRLVEAEGLQFLESMGFILDNLHFREMSPDQKDQTLRRVPMFSRPKPRVPTSSRGDPGSPSSSEALALLLASF